MPRNLQWDETNYTTKIFETLLRKDNLSRLPYWKIKVFFLFYLQFTVCNDWVLRKPCLCSKLLLFKISWLMLEELLQLSSLDPSLPYLRAFQWGTLKTYTSRGIKNTTPTQATIRTLKNSYRTLRNSSLRLIKLLQDFFENSLETQFWHLMIHNWLRLQRMVIKILLNFYFKTMYQISEVMNHP